MTPTTIYRAGDVVLTPFPYADQSGEKKRPAVLLSSDRVSLDTGLHIACMITSHAPRGPWDVEVLAWQEAGLLFPSVVRCPEVFGLDQSLILRQLGRLAMSDWGRRRGASQVSLRGVPRRPPG
jgi:mRNA interferase MazF